MGKHGLHKHSFYTILPPDTSNFDILRVVSGEKLIYFWRSGAPNLHTGAIKKNVHLGILYSQRPEKVENTGIFYSSNQLIF